MSLVSLQDQIVELMSQAFELKLDNVRLKATVDILEKEKENKPLFQLCPKCHGQGVVCKPPGLPAEVTTWSHTSASFTCDVCNGQKLISSAYLIGK